MSQPAFAHGSAHATAEASLLDLVAEATARAEAPTTAGLVFGTVTALPNEATAYRVTVDDVELSCARAASCLLEPNLGDRVLVARQGAEAYLMSVLTRTQAVAVLSVPTPGQEAGDLSVRAKGQLSMVGGKQAAIVSGGEVSVEAPRLAVRALETSFFSRTLKHVGQLVQAEVEKLQLTARSLDTKVERVRERVQRAYRNVEEIDQLRAGQVDYVVEGNLRVHADNTVVTADKLVKMNGQQVHLG